MSVRILSFKNFKVKTHLIIQKDITDAEDLHLTRKAESGDPLINIKFNIYDE